MDSIIENYKKNKNIPHILIYGEHNSGKRRILSKLLDTIYSQEMKKLYCMYIECATFKGIKMIRDDIKEFSKQNTYQVPFKSVILYDADNLTIDAQYSLRRCIEIYSNNTRFFIVTHNKDKLLNPICSRFIHMYIPYKTFESGSSIHVPSSKNEIELLEIAEKLYSEGIYGDLILNKMKNMPKEKYIKIKFYYESICKELKNETMIIYYLLCYYRNII
jgi:DNA polymerase III delta prime subunit